MKKFKKIVACGLALSAVAGTYAEIAPHKEVLKADTQLEKIEAVTNFSIVGMPLEAVVSNTPIILPEVSSALITVKDFYGNEIDTVEKGFNVATRELTIKNACDYIVTYTKDGVSKSFVIKVSGEVEELTFASNTAQFIPTELFAGQKVTLPKPSNENLESYKVYVNNQELTKDAQAEYYVFAPAENAAGTYSIRYEATLQGSGAVVNKTFSNINVVAKDSYKVEVGYEWSKSVPTTAEAYEELTLPTVKTHNLKNNNQNLENFTKVEYRYVNSQGEATNWAVAENFKFTPEKLCDGTSYYEIKYTIETIHSLNDLVEEKVEVFTLKEVKDTKIEFEDLQLKPTVVANSVVEFTPKLKNEKEAPKSLKVIVKNRDKAELGSDKLTNTEGTYKFTALPSERYTIVLEAEDASGNKRISDGFVISVVSTDSVKPEVKDIENVKVTPAEAGAEQVEVVLPEASDNIAYNLTYNVEVTNKEGEVSYKDKDGNAKTVSTENPLVAGDVVVFKKLLTNESKITVTVSDGVVENEVQKTYTVKAKNDAAPTLTVESNVGVDSAVQGETVILPKITIGDASIQSTKVYFDLTIGGVDYSRTVYGRSTTYRKADAGAGEDAALTYMDLTGVKFVAATAGEAVFTITAVDSDNNMVVKAYKFDISSDSNPYMSIGKMPTEAKVYERVALPTPKFKDTSETYTWEVVTIGEETPAYNIDEESDKKYFIAEAPGTFVIKYIVKDSNGVFVTESAAYTITATDSDAPTFTLNTGSNGLYVPSQIEYNGTALTFNLPGFRSVADSGKSELVKEYKLTVKDPDGDSYSVTFDNVKREYTHSEGNDPTVLKYNPSANKFELLINQSGNYTLKYEVVDFNGNTTTADVSKEVNGEMKVVVGDIFAPSINDKDVSIKETYKQGEAFVANIKDLILTDNKTNFEEGAVKAYKDGKLKVNLYKGSETVAISVDDDLNIKLNSTDGSDALEVGDNYRLVITLTDDAGKTAIKTYNIEVKAEEVETVSHEKVWGIVLICISVAVLGAVVVYFVLTREKKSAPALSKKEEKKEEDKPEQE